MELEEEQLKTKLVEEIKYQEREEPSFPSEDMSKIQEESNGDHINTIKKIISKGSMRVLCV